MEPINKILSGAEHLFMRYGIKSMTMDSISKELGISKKTLYQFVDNKTDLIEQVIRLHLQAELVSLEEIRDNAKDAIDEILGFAKYGIQQLRELNPTTIYDLQKHYRPVWDMLESLHMEQVYGFIKDNIEKGIEEGLYRRNLNPDIIAKLYGGKTVLVVNEDLFPLKDYNKEKLFEAYIQYHIHGVASAKGLKRLEKYLLKEK